MRIHLDRTGIVRTSVLDIMKTGYVQIFINIIGDNKWVQTNW
jgi:hypothetical protein